MDAHEKGLPAFLVLGVVPIEVVDKDSKRGASLESGVGSMLIVHPEPLLQDGLALGVRGIKAAIGPFGQGRLDEAIRLAIGLGAIRSGAFVARTQVVQGVLEGAGGRVGAGVVGEHAFDRGNPLGGKEGGRIAQEAGAGRPTFVGMELGDGNPRVVIDGDVQIFVAQAPTRGAGGPAMPAMAAADRNPPPLLHIQMQQRTRV